MNTISESTTINNSSGYNWPVTVNGGTVANPVVVSFGNDISFNSDDQYWFSSKWFYY